MKDEAKIKSKYKRKFLLKFLLQQKLDQTNKTIVTFHFWIEAKRRALSLIKVAQYYQTQSNSECSQKLLFLVKSKKSGKLIQFYKKRWTPSTLPMHPLIFHPRGLNHIPIVVIPTLDPNISRPWSES